MDSLDLQDHQRRKASAKGRLTNIVTQVRTYQPHERGKLWHLLLKKIDNSYISFASHW